MQSSNFLKRSFKKSDKYHINKETLIGSVSKSTLYYKKIRKTPVLKESQDQVENRNLMNL